LTDCRPSRGPTSLISTSFFEWLVIVDKIL
jgi:hypothetical protein